MSKADKARIAQLEAELAGARKDVACMDFLCDLSDYGSWPLAVVEVSEYDGKVCGFNFCNEKFHPEEGIEFVGEDFRESILLAIEARTPIDRRAAVAAEKYIEKLEDKLAQRV